MTLLLGIDIGGTKIAGGLVNDQGAVVASEQVPANAYDGGKQVLESALNLASQLLGMAKEPVEGIGIGAGGQINSDLGVVVSATAVLPGWAGIDIKSSFASRFNLPVHVDNDVNALASGEITFGAAKDLKCLAFMTLGTGVGGAIVMDGKIHHGARWTGGELGHIILDPSQDARADLGGARGTLEAYCSGEGLFQTYLALVGPEDSVTDASCVGRLALSEPDSLAAEAVRKTGRYLGLGLVSIANILDPDIIIIGGGLSTLGDLLLEPARQVLRSRALAGPANCPVVTASLGEHASIIGAVSLAIRASGRLN